MAAPQTAKHRAECLAATYEASQKRLLGTLIFNCYTQVGLAVRIESALRACLELLGADPALARLVLVDGPGAGGELARRHHEWLDRYARMLRFATVGSPEIATPPRPIEPAIVGGMVSCVKQLVLAGEAARLPSLCPELTRFALSFYGSAEAPADRTPASRPRYGEVSPQPQSPERLSVLEPA